MHNLIALSPLGQTDAQSLTIGTISIAEVTNRALASVSCRLGQDKGFATTAKKVFGIVPPGPGHWQAGSTYSLMWTGPDQWFVDAPYATHDDISATLKAAFGAIASITEQTDAWVRFDLIGAHVVAMLERLSAVNTRAMAEGQATRTLVEHLGCYLICRGDSQFSLLGPRSSAASLLHAITGAAYSVA